MPTSTDDNLVLIIGQRPDPHIDTVAARLRKLACDVAVLDRYDPRQGVQLSSGPARRRSETIRTEDREFSLAQVGSVWWRVKPYRDADFGFIGSSVDNAFAAREWMEVLRALADLVPSVFWVNRLANHVRIGRKPWQLALAGSAGLECPRTMISNSSAAVLDFFDPVIPLVYKTLSSFIQPPDRIVFTNVVSRDVIAESREEIALAPGIFQERLDKLYELRVTIVGDQVFAVRVDSQSAASTRVDWRRDQGRAMYSVASLSPETERCLLRFHREAGLVFATYDFVVSPEGREVFLECNPGGQWLWLERELGLGISNSLASVLSGQGTLSFVKTPSA